MKKRIFAAACLVLALAAVLTACAVTSPDDSGACVHNWQNATCIQPKICGKCGKTSGSPLGHTTTQGLCARCNTTIGTQTSVKPGYISNRSINHKDDNGGYFYFLFSFLDADKNEIKYGATVDIRIVNNADETVYTKTHTVTEKDFGNWENKTLNKQWMAASIYIYDSAITPGLSDSGKFYYTIRSDDGTKWDEYSLDITGNLPVKETILGMGQTWNMPNQWNFTIDSVQTHYACNDYTTNNNAAQYIIITYSYENLGFDYYSSGLAFSSGDIKVYDANGVAAEKYTCISHAKDYQYVDKNGKCVGAQLVFAMPNKSDNIRIVVDKNCKLGNQKATFNLSVGGCQHIVRVDAGKAATCEQDGMTEGQTCTICQSVLVQPQVIKATGHKFSNDVCTVCKAPNKNSDTYKYNTLKKKADGLATSCAETVLRGLLKNPNTLAVLAVDVTDSDQYFRYAVHIRYTAQNNLGGYVTDDFYVLLKVNSIMDGTFVYHRDTLDYQYPITTAQKQAFDWNIKPSDFTLDSIDKFENPTEVSLKLIVAYPSRYEGQYVRIKEEVILRRNDLGKKEFYVYLSTGDGKFDYNSDVTAYIMYRLCDNVDDLIMLDADYQKLTIEGYVKVYANSTEPYIEAYNIIVKQ